MTEVMRHRWAQLYFNSEIIAVASFSGYRGGSFFDFKQARHLLAKDCSDECLGSAVLKALASSRFLLASRRKGSIYPRDLEFDAEVGSPRTVVEHFDA